MATFAFADNIKDTSTAQSGSTITLSGSAPTGFQSFNSGVGDTNFTVYGVKDTSGNWEVNYGVYTNSAKTLGRAATPLASSNAGAQVVSFSGTVTALVGPEALMFMRAMGGLLGGLGSFATLQHYWSPPWTGFATSTAGGSLANGNTFYCPIWIGQPFSSISLRINISALAAATATATLGLYSDVGGGPVTLLGTSSSIVVGNQGGGATGEQAVSITLSSTIPNLPGMYWGAIALPTAAASASFFKGGSMQANPQLLGTQTIAAIGSQGGYAWLGNTALPGTTTPASFSQFTPGNLPAMTAQTGF